MPVIKFLQILSTIFGLAGIGFASYWYYRRLSVVGIPVIVAVSILALALGQTLPFVWLVTAGKTNLATVVKVDCLPGQKHHIQYQFSVGSDLVDDIGPDGYGNPTCEFVKAGDSGMVTYIPNEPTIHVWGRASEYLIERLVASLLALVLVPTFSFFAVRKKIENQ